MQSVKVVTEVLNNIIKATHTTYSAVDLLKDHTQQIVKFYDAMDMEIKELEELVKAKDVRIAELEAEIEKMKKEPRENSTLPDDWDYNAPVET